MGASGVVLELESLRLDMCDAQHSMLDVDDEREIADRPGSDVGLLTTLVLVAHSMVSISFLTDNCGTPCNGERR